MIGEWYKNKDSLIILFQLYLSKTYLLRINKSTCNKHSIMSIGISLAHLFTFTLS